jgi:hypothetical protein
MEHEFIEFCQSHETRKSGHTQADLFSFHLQIQKAKAERARDRILKEEMDAKRAKNKALRERRLERKEAKRDALINEE